MKSSTAILWKAHLLFYGQLDSNFKMEVICFSVRYFSNGGNFSTEVICVCFVWFIEHLFFVCFAFLFKVPSIKSNAKSFKSADVKHKNSHKSQLYSALQQFYLTFFSHFFWLLSTISNTATHCNTLQHTATPSHSSRPTFPVVIFRSSIATHLFNYWFSCWRSIISKKERKKERKRESKVVQVSRAPHHFSQLEILNKSAL